MKRIHPTALASAAAQLATTEALLRRAARIAPPGGRTLLLERATLTARQRAALAALMARGGRPVPASATPAAGPQTATRRLVDGPWA